MNLRQLVEDFIARSKKGVSSLGEAFQQVRRGPMVSPLPRGQGRPAPRPTPTATPTPQVAGATMQPPLPRPEVERKMRQGLRAYAGGAELPIENYIPMFAEATEKYPIFGQHPFLLPQISILESSAGRNVTRQNNPLNWAARVQAAGGYNPQSWEQSIRDLITAIGGDVQARPPTQPARHRQTTYYEPFRKTGNLQVFAETFEPANKDYYDALIKGMKLFERQ